MLNLIFSPLLIVEIGVPSSSVTEMLAKPLSSFALLFTDAETVYEVVSTNTYSLLTADKLPAWSSAQIWMTLIPAFCAAKRSVVKSVEPPLSSSSPFLTMYLKNPN